MTRREEPLHPGSLELIHYVRGTLDAGHAAAVLAHCVLCERCNRRLRAFLASADRSAPRDGPDQGVPSANLPGLRPRG